MKKIRSILFQCGWWEHGNFTKKKFEWNYEKKNKKIFARCSIKGRKFENEDMYTGIFLTNNKNVS